MSDHHHGHTPPSPLAGCTPKAPEESLPPATGSSGTTSSGRGNPALAWMQTAAASGLTLQFQGMCGIVHRTASGTEYWEVLLHPGSLHPHRASIVARIKDVNIRRRKPGESLAWEPDYLGIDKDGDQIGVWTIAHVSRLKGGSGAKLPDWRDRNRAIDLSVFHADASSKPTIDIIKQVPGLSVITLRGGEIRGYKTRGLNVHKPKPKPKDHVGDYSSGFQWTDSDLVLVNDTDPSIAKTIRFNEGAIAGVQNVAMVDEVEGLNHFHHYYDFLDGVPTDHQLGITALPKDEDVYDCIPPVPLP